MSTTVFKRSVNFSPYEKDQLLRLIQEYIIIFEDKRLDGVGRREKERAWLELTDRYNSQENVNLRTSKQLQSCWKNLKNRARDLTEACKRGENLSFFSVSSKHSTSYFPSSIDEDEDGATIRVKRELYSDDDDDDTNENAVSFESEPYPVSDSPCSTVESPPVINYVYSPGIPNPTPPPLTPGQGTAKSPPPSSGDTLSNQPQRHERNVAKRLPYLIPQFRAAERNKAKSVDRIANSILFEKGVFDRTAPLGLFGSDNRNGLIFPLMNSGNSPETTTRQHEPDPQPKPISLVRKSDVVESFSNRNDEKHGGSPEQTAVNGCIKPKRIGQEAKYRRLEHQARMKNLQFERECIEKEHNLKCELLRLKMEFYKRKLDNEVSPSE